MNIRILSIVKCWCCWTFFVQYLPLEMCIFSYVLFFFPPSILKENKIEYVFSNSKCMLYTSKNILITRTVLIFRYILFLVYSYVCSNTFLYLNHSYYLINWINNTQDEFYLHKRCTSCVRLIFSNLPLI